MKHFLNIRCTYSVYDGGGEGRAKKGERFKHNENQIDENYVIKIYLIYTSGMEPERRLPYIPKKVSLIKEHKEVGIVFEN